MDLVKLWNENGFEIVLLLSIIFMLCCMVYQWFNGKSGSWSRSYYYDNKKLNKYRTKTNISLQNTQNTQNQNTHRRPTTQSKGEIECKRVLETIFRRPFNKARPSSMYNEVTNVNLELDCFNEHMKLACEYNGRQHYQYTPYFHGNSIDKFRAQQYRDFMKSVLCEKNGITLIIVPYTVKIDDIEDYIKNILKQTRYKRHIINTSNTVQNLHY